MAVLFVCSGNVCRSPVAERLLRVWLDQQDENSGLSVFSAGTDAVHGQPMDEQSAQALIDLGGDPAGFTSRQLDVHGIQRASLVLTMTRKQRRAVLTRLPRARQRTFTLTEASDLLAIADLSGLEHTPLQGRAVELAARLHAVRSTRVDSIDDDIRDPIRRPRELHHAVGQQIADALAPLAECLLRPGQPVVRRIDVVRPAPPPAAPPPAGGAADPGPSPTRDAAAVPAPAGATALHGATPRAVSTFLDRDHDDPPVGAPVLDERPPAETSADELVGDDPVPGKFRRRPRRRLVQSAVGAAAVAALVGTAVILTRDADQPAGRVTPAAPATVAAPALVLPADPQLMILGDSFTEGVGAEPQSEGWAYQAAVTLGWVAEVHAFPGSGYTTASDINPRTFPQRITDLATRPFVPDLLIVQGGEKDIGAPAASISAAVQETVTNARAAWPDVQVVVLGIIAPQSETAGLDGVNSAERQGAAAAGAPFIDPLAGDWFTTSTGVRSTASDGEHLNNRGNQEVLERLLDDLGALTGSS